MNSERRIPVALGIARNGISADFAGRPPVIQVYATFDPNWSVKSVSGPRHNGEIYSALIDTGAENTAIDARIAHAIGAPKIGTGIVHAMNGRHKSVSMVNLQIFLPRQNIVFGAKASALDFRADGQTFDIILGRTFLAHCSLYVDGPRELYSLEWLA
jgi:predicted aspartyl protease